MKTIWLITKRELNSFFDSLIAFIMIVLFLGFSGFFTWISGSDIFLIGQASLRTFFSIAYWTLFFFIPALTMRLIAEEKKTGTIEMLLTKAVTDRQVILGKYLATLLLISVALLFTLPYVITVAKLGNLDGGGTICGYLALFLMSAAYTSIGLFTSSITSNQIVAFLSALFIGLFFHIIFGVIASGMTGFTRPDHQFIEYYSPFRKPFTGSCRLERHCLLRINNIFRIVPYRGVTGKKECF